MVMKVIIVISGVSASESEGKAHRTSNFYCFSISDAQFRIADKGAALGLSTLVLSKAVAPSFVDDIKLIS